MSFFLGVGAKLEHPLVAAAAAAMSRRCLRAGRCRRIHLLQSLPPLRHDHHYLRTPASRGGATRKRTCGTAAASAAALAPPGSCRNDNRRHHHRHHHRRRRHFSSSNSTGCGDDNDDNNNKPAMNWLDLRGSGLSVLERLLLEECLLRCDDDGGTAANPDDGGGGGGGGGSWMIVGHHEPTRNRYLPNSEEGGEGRPSRPRGLSMRPPSPYVPPEEDFRNPNAVIVMGIGGKPERLLNVDAVRRDQVLTLKRFSGGGTVVLDENSIYTTVIGRHCDFPSVEPFPRPIMSWSADTVFGPLFERMREVQQQRQRQQRNDGVGNHDDVSTGSRDGKKKKKNLIEGRRARGGGRQQQQQTTLVLDTKSCASEVTGRVVTVPKPTDTASEGGGGGDFELRENDYVLGERKMGGNAQAIVKSGWLHHTSFLWDYAPGNMEYLLLPEKRPAYRENKDHSEFLTSLRRRYPHLSKSDFYAHLKGVCEAAFDLRTVTFPEAMSIVERQVGGGGGPGGAGGGMQSWFEKGGRTRIVHHHEDMKVKEGNNSRSS